MRNFLIKLLAEIPRDMFTVSKEDSSKERLCHTFYQPFLYVGAAISRSRTDKMK